MDLSLRHKGRMTLEEYKLKRQHETDMMMASRMSDSGNNTLMMGGDPVGLSQIGSPYNAAEGA